MVKGIMSWFKRSKRRLPAMYYRHPSIWNLSMMAQRLYC